MTLDEIKKMITSIISPHPARRVILFGSRARRDAGKNSDADLLVDSGGQLSAFDHFGIAGLIIKNMPVKADVFEQREINRPSEMFDNISKEGIVVYEP